jgi:hypothetical protein
MEIIWSDKPVQTEVVELAVRAPITFAVEKLFRAARDIAYAPSSKAVSEGEQSNRTQRRPAYDVSAFRSR